MNRTQLRNRSLGGLFLLSALFIYAGFDGWVLKEKLPLQYIGYFTTVVGVLGLLGVNVWVGGPLDKGKDPKQAD